MAEKNVFGRRFFSDVSFHPILNLITGFLAAAAKTSAKAREHTLFTNTAKLWETTTNHNLNHAPPHPRHRLQHHPLAGAERPNLGSQVHGQFGILAL